MPRENTMTEGLQLLRTAGITATAGTLDALRLTMPDNTTREVTVLAPDTPPTPTTLTRILARPNRHLIITERPGKAVMEAAQDNRLDLIILDTATITIDGKPLATQAPATTPAPQKRQGRPAWGRWAVARALLLSDKPLTQHQLAAEAGISQPAVTKTLKYLADLVHRTDEGWAPTDWTALLAKLLVAYPGPAGASTYWYSLDAAASQARAAAKHAEASGAAPLVSGDTAADEYAPWRLPDKAHIYLKAAVDFSAAGFTPSSPEEATMIATIVEDPTLWLTAALTDRHDPPLADPIITLAEILLSDAVDSKDAADHLTRYLIGRHHQ